MGGTSISNAYKQICDEAARCGEVVCADFNGKEMRSDEFIEDFYFRYYGRSKAAVEAEIEAELEESRRTLAYREKHLPERAEELKAMARGIVVWHQLPYWDKTVDDNITKYYYGYEFEAALGLIKILSSDKPWAERQSEAKILFDKQGHSGVTGACTLNLVTRFVDGGRKFAHSIL